VERYHGASPTLRADLLDANESLARYLDSGGSYDDTARALKIHRSTLRHRLERIRDISGHDLQDVETRLNLHLATKVSEMIGETQPILRAISSSERGPSDEWTPK
jgi:DNA-binding PucR family transcriptional regulator